MLGLIEGPTRLKEEVIVCAHYDHDGADGTRIFNGADDDGSGIVALIEIAEAYVQAASGIGRGAPCLRGVELRRARPARRVGTRAPTRPLENVAVLNMDMLGRNEEVPPRGGALPRASAADGGVQQQRVNIGTSRART